MTLPKDKILEALGMIILAFLVIVAGGLYWADMTEDACWEHEATQAFQKYGSLKSRSDILRFADTEDDPKSNPLEVVEKDPNGCSLGSNGRTVLRFTFDDANELTTIQVFRDYIASDYEMELIEERRF